MSKQAINPKSRTTVPLDNLRKNRDSLSVGVCTSSNEDVKCHGF